MLSVVAVVPFRCDLAARGDDADNNGARRYDEEPRCGIVRGARPGYPVLMASTTDVSLGNTSFLKAQLRRCSRSYALGNFRGNPN
jgi:hypothetical protein